MANAWPCVNTINGAPCGGKRTAGIHSIHHENHHPYWKNKPIGIQPVSEGVRNMRRDTGYDAELREKRGTPCQVVSPECTGTVQHLHEPASRGRFGGFAKAVEVGGAVPCCDACNSYIATNPVWAAEHGWSFSNTIEGRAAASEAKLARAAGKVLAEAQAKHDDARIAAALEALSRPIADHLDQVVTEHKEGRPAPIRPPTRRKSRLQAD